MLPEWPQSCPLLASTISTKRLSGCPGHTGIVSNRESKLESEVACRYLGTEDKAAQFSSSTRWLWTKSDHVRLLIISKQWLMTAGWLVVTELAIILHTLALPLVPWWCQSGLGSSIAFTKWSGDCGWLGSSAEWIWPDVGCISYVKRNKVVHVSTTYRYSMTCLQWFTSIAPSFPLFILSTGQAKLAWHL